MSQDTLPVPIDTATTVRDLRDAWERLTRWARDVDDHLLRQPSVEVVQVEIDPAGLPVVVECQTPTANVRGVVRAQTVNQTNGALVTNTDLGWRQPSELPGIEITSLPGCSSGTTYALTFEVLGRRDG